MLQNEAWLAGSICFPESIFTECLITPQKTRSEETKKIGRPLKLFHDCTERSKRRKVEDLLKNRSPKELSFATQSSLIQSGKRDAADIVRELSEASPQRETNSKRSRAVAQKNEGIPYTKEEALAYFIDSKSTVHQYKFSYKESKQRHFNMFPPYSAVLEAKQDCYPASEHVRVGDICRSTITSTSKDNN